MIRCSIIGICHMTRCRPDEKCWTRCTTRCRPDFDQIKNVLRLKVPYSSAKCQPYEYDQMSNQMKCSTRYRPDVDQIKNVGPDEKCLMQDHQKRCNGIDLEHMDRSGTHGCEGCVGCDGLRMCSWCWPDVGIYDNIYVITTIYIRCETDKRGISCSASYYIGIYANIWSTSVMDVMDVFQICYYICYYIGISGQHIHYIWSTSMYMPM